MLLLLLLPMMMMILVMMIMLMMLQLLNISESLFTDCLYHYCTVKYWASPLFATRNEKL